VAAVGLKSRDAALLILALGVLRHYGWVPFDPELRGIASKALGGLALLGVVPFIYKAYPSRLMALVLAWWSFEALQILLCSIAWAIAPWEVPTGQSICSVGIGLDLGTIGVMLVMLLIWKIVNCQPLQGPTDK
jgi:uncharacterized YccA/Bax inhibitor family protein